MDQLSLDILDSNKTKTLNIIKDGKVVEMKLKEIFDYNKYDELYAITYVSSPSFFSKVIKPFNKVTFIIGIPDSDYLNYFKNGALALLNVEEKVEFLNKLDQNVKEKIIGNSLQIRYSIKDYSVHTKLYLLKNSQNSENRLIIGSANLTEKAFAKKTQFEDILIMDNSPLYEVYSERFKDIYNSTEDFIPERYKKEIKRIKEKEHVILPVSWSNDEISSTVQEELLEKGKLLAIPEDLYNDINKLPERFAADKEEAEKWSRVLKKTTVKDKKEGSYKFSFKNKEKGNNIIKELLTFNKKKEAKKSVLTFYKYSEENNTIYAVNPETNESRVISKEVPIDTIKNNLKSIVKFIDAYRLFTHNPTVSNQSKVFEIILYAFMSPFIWKMQDDYMIEEGSKSTVYRFSPFLIIGGTSGSGKTTTLEFVSRLLGGDYKSILPYQDIGDARKGILSKLFMTENVFPLLVDEMSQQFFKSKSQNLGENLIKYIGNEVVTVHPVMIGTTNYTDFNIADQTLKRIYYLQVDRTFSKVSEEESKKHLDDVYANISSDLFRDFTFKVSQLINSNEKFYSFDDFLVAGREIFKHYFEIAGMPVPEWFPDSIFHDYYERTRRIWRDIYKSHRECFEEAMDETEKVKVLKIDTSRLQSSDSKTDNNVLINYLPDECIKDSVTSLNYLILYEKEFNDFIGSQIKESLISKISSFFWS